MVFENGKVVPVEGTEREMPTQLVLLAMGFTGPETDTVVSQLGVEPGRARATSRGTRTTPPTSRGSSPAATPAAGSP